MKKFIVIAITLFASVFTYAQSAAIEGNWGVNQSESGFTFDITFSITKNAVTITNVCSGFGTSATAQVTSASTYNDQTLTVLEAKQDQKSSGPLNCNVNTEPDTLNYVVQGNQLILTRVGSPNMIVLIKK